MLGAVVGLVAVAGLAAAIPLGAVVVALLAVGVSLGAVVVPLVAVVGVAVVVGLGAGVGSGAVAGLVVVSLGRVVRLAWLAGFVAVGAFLQEGQALGDVPDHRLRVVGDLGRAVRGARGQPGTRQGAPDLALDRTHARGRVLDLGQQLTDELRVHAVELAHGSLPDVAPLRGSP
uniref:hypothetical protein n=1 Tax=Nonomuraea pusilla TaxID=46177 RepID=UPI00128F0A70|nr:hypothetical protein [Nonomuraea pusilla]